MSGLQLAGDSFVDHTITLVATIGTVPANEVDVLFPFTLKLKNPCIDPAFVQIESVALP